MSVLSAAPPGPFNVVGTRHYVDLPRQSGERVYILKEHDNVHDKHAFGVYAKVGNLPRSVAKRLDERSAFLGEISAFREVVTDDDEQRKSDFSVRVVKAMRMK